MMTLDLPQTKTMPRFTMRAFVFVSLASVLAFAPSSFCQSSAQLQQIAVQLDADGLAPRPIEGLTGTTIVRHYAQAWHDMADALDSGRVERLGDDFTGFARDRLIQRIAAQNRTGVHMRIVDHGHHLKAVFYSTDGTVMQLFDQAQLEIQTFDGNKLLDTQTVPHEYMVLMTPGADRWYIRDLEEVSAKSN
jgi:hypothetical protein